VSHTPFPSPLLLSSLTASFFFFFSRMIHVWVSPRYVNDLGWRGKLEWFGCTTSVVVLSFVIANAIPFFEELTSLVGGLLVPSLNLIFPILFYGE